MNSREIIKKLEGEDWHHARTKGSHWIMKNPDGRITVVPHPEKDVPIGTVKAIEKQTGVKLIN